MASGDALGPILARILGMELHGPNDLLLFRGEVFALRAALPPSQGSDDPARRHADRLIAVVGDAFRLTSSLQRTVTAESYSRMATMLDAGGIGALAAQTLIGGEGSLKKIILGFIAEALVLAGSVQYIKGAAESIEEALVAGTVDLQGHLWAIVDDLRGPLGVAAASEVRSGIEGMLQALASGAQPAEQRAGMLIQLYAVVARIRLLLMVAAVSGVAPAAAERKSPGPRRAGAG